MKIKDGEIFLKGRARNYQSIAVYKEKLSEIRFFQTSEIGEIKINTEDNLLDFNIVILCENNIKDYINLPDHIMKKYFEGKISRTHFSDILRVAILAQYGGLWLDSTVFCTDGLFAEKIIKYPLFVYKVMNLDQNDDEAIMASSWLMSATSNDPYCH